MRKRTLDRQSFRLRRQTKQARTLLSDATCKHIEGGEQRMDEQKLNSLLKQYWRLGVQLKELQSANSHLSTQAFPFAQLEMLLRWLRKRLAQYYGELLADQTHAQIQIQRSKRSSNPQKIAREYQAIRPVLAQRLGELLLEKRVGPSRWWSHMLEC